MSLIPEKKDKSASKWKAYVLPAYIIISAFIIIFFVYNFVMNGIYNSGVNLGAQKGYQTAIEQLIENASSKCEPIAVTSGEQKIEVINVACLQAVENQTPTESISE